MALGKNKVPEYQFKKSKGFTFMPDLIAFARFLAPLLKFKVSVDGIDIQEIEGGVHLTGKAGAGGSHPFKIHSIGEGFYTFEDGTVSGLTPTIGGFLISNEPPPALFMGDSGSVGAYLAITVTPSGGNRGTTDDPEWYIEGCVVDSVEIIASSGDPTGTAASIDRVTGAVDGGTYYRRIVTVNDGIAPTDSQPVRFSLDVGMCDNAGDGSLRIGVSG